MNKFNTRGDRNLINGSLDINVRSATVAGSIAATSLTVQGTTSLTNQVAGSVALTIKGAVSQSAALLNIKDSNNTPLASISSNGGLICAAINNTSLTYTTGTISKSSRLVTGSGTTFVSNMVG